MAVQQFREYPGTVSQPIVPIKNDYHPNDAYAAKKPPPIVPLPDGQKNLLSHQRNYDSSVYNLMSGEANQDEGYYDSRLNYGQTDGLMGSEADPMAQALQQRYNQQYAASGDLMKKENEANSRRMATESTNSAMNKQQKVYEKQQQNFQEQVAYRLKREAIFDQWLTAKERGKMDILGKLFTGGAAAVGFVVGGPVGGAAAGGAANAAVS